VPDRRVAILLIAHGSRRPEANADLELVADQLRKRGHFPVIQTAFLELADPSIKTGGARCVDSGATDVILLPYFLSPGKHVVEDLRLHRAQLRERYPSIRFVLAEPIGSHPLVLEVLEDRAREADER
jgi:sirohydrochlorin ferrochelatase